MTWISYTDLQNATGSTDASGNLIAIIEDAEREITAYLDARGISASSCDACKSAELSLSKAGLLEYWVTRGRFLENAGEFVTGADGASAWNMPQMIKLLREKAFRILDDYAAVQTSLDTPRRFSMFRVN